MVSEVSNKDSSSDDIGLVHRFVREAMVIANVKLQSWIRKYAVYFEDDQNEIDAKGESLQQYQVYKQWVSQLETQLKSFWVKEGFNNVEDCFSAIENAVNRDKIRHKEAIASFLSQLQASATFMGQIASSGQEAQKAAEAVAAAAAPLLCLMLLPVSQEELVDMVLRLAEYSTFARMMRAYAKQLKADREGRKKMRGFLNNDKAEPKSPNSPNKKEPAFFKEECSNEMKSDHLTITKNVSPISKAPTKIAEQPNRSARSGRIEVKTGESTKALHFHDNDEDDDDDDDDDICSPQTTHSRHNNDAKKVFPQSNKVTVKRGWG